MNGRVVTLILVLSVAPTIVSAQAQAKPRWSIDVGLGEGPHTGHSGDVYYRTASANVGHLSATYRFGAGALRPIARAELLTEGPGSEYDDCATAPNGSCRQEFPVPNGVGVAAGVMYSPAARLEIALLAGAGRYGTTRTFVQAEAAVAIGRRVAATASLRQMTWDEPGAAGVWYRPLAVGVRYGW